MDVMQAILNRRSVREYNPRAIPDDVLARMRQALWAAAVPLGYSAWKRDGSGA